MRTTARTKRTMAGPASKATTGAGPAARIGQSRTTRRPCARLARARARAFGVLATIAESGATRSASARRAAAKVIVKEEKETKAKEKEKARACSAATTTATTTTRAKAKARANATIAASRGISLVSVRKGAVHKESGMGTDMGATDTNKAVIQECLHSARCGPEEVRLHGETRA